MRRTAVISECGAYRYSLTRRWRDSGFSPLVWVMLNPSTADAWYDDPTIRRCIAFSQAWDYDAMTVINLYAWRATDPSDVPRQPELARGPDFFDYVMPCIDSAFRVVAAWGAQGGAELPDWLSGRIVECLGTTKSGAPRHPLYLKSETQLQPFTGTRKL